MKPLSVFTQAQAVLLNSDCDPYEAGAQALAALYVFAATELEGSPLSHVVHQCLLALVDLDPTNAAAVAAARLARKALRDIVPSTASTKKRARSAPAVPK